MNRESAGRGGEVGTARCSLAETLMAIVL